MRDVVPGFDAEEFLRWTVSSLHLPKGVKWRFYPALLSLYLASEREIVVQKGAQLGVSTWAIARVLYALSRREPINILYVLPSRPKCIQFVRTKFEPILFTSPLFGDIDPAVNSVFMKRIGHSHVIFDGAGSPAQTTSLDADFLVLDEWSFLPDEIRSLYEGRTRGSVSPLHFWISTPYLAGQGVELLMRDATTCELWHVKCRSCGEWVPLDPAEYPALIRASDPPYFSCPACSKPLDPSDPDAKECRKWGRFRPENKDAPLRGLLLSPIYDPAISAKHLRSVEHRYRLRGTDFYRQILGVPAPDAGGRPFSLPTLREYIRPLPEKLVSVTVGVDQAIAGLAAVALGADQDGQFHILGGRLFEDVNACAQFIAEENAAVVLVDEMPETRQALALAHRCLAPTFLAHAQRRTAPWYLLKDDRLFFDPNAAMDELYALLRTSKLFFAETCEIANTLAKMLFECERVEVDKKIGGFVVRSFAWKVPEGAHYLHALLHAVLAMEFLLPAIGISVPGLETRPATQAPPLTVAGAEEEATTSRPTGWPLWLEEIRQQGQEEEWP